MTTCTAPVRGHQTQESTAKCPRCNNSRGASLSSARTAPRTSVARLRPATEQWLRSERTLSFLATVSDEHHPWLRELAASARRGVPALPGMGLPSSPVRVGFDIDEVLYPWEDTFRDYLIAHEGFAPDACPPRDTYDFDEWFASEADFVAAMRRGETEGGINSCASAPIAGASDVTQTLVSAGHEVHLVTARFPHEGKTIEETSGWLARHDIAYSSLTCSRDKRAVTTDLFLDDKVANCDTLADAGTLAVVMDASHNQACDHHLRVEDLQVWGDIVDSYSRWAA